MESSGQSVYISHHAVKCHRAVPRDEHDCVYMGIIHVQKRVGRELHRLVFTTTPLMKGCIELIGYISTAQQKKRPHLLPSQPKPPWVLAPHGVIPHHGLDELGSGD